MASSSRLSAGMARPKRSLGAIIDAIPTQVDSIPDSCSDSGFSSHSGSDNEDDEALPTPRPIPLTPHAQTPYSVNGKGKARATPLGGVTPAQSKVEMSVGTGGRMVYQYIGEGPPSQYYSVQLRKPQYKKHKTWDEDAYIKVTGHKVVMIDADGNQKAVGSVSEKTYLGPGGDEFRLGNYEVGIDSEITQEEFKANTTCLKRMNKLANVEPTTAAAYRPATFAKPFRTPIQTHPPKPMGKYLPARTSESETIDSPVPIAGPSRAFQVPGPANAATPTRSVAATSFYAKPTPKHRAERIVLGEKSNKERLEWGGALFNPNAPDAVVMPRPKEILAQIKNTEIMDVVVDPLLAAVMRQHQKDGVKFMYSCIMGLTNAESEGCILADEMGLGKTLQTIALIYTLLKQSPFANQSSVINKALIVCPVTLVENWKKEFKKWVDKRVNVMIADGADYRISSFINNKHQQVLVVGYERFRKCSKELAACQPPIDLIVCDEGHRLKSKDNKLTRAFDHLRTQRRIILSGTPVQNDLGEYWAMSNFVCPGLLGKYSSFNKQFEKPILKSREQRCSAAEAAKGREASEELSKLSKEYVLRRTADVLNKYLPPKFEYVLFVAPSTLQLDVFAKLLNPTTVGGCISGYGIQSLALIDMMRKVANSPMLLRKKDEDVSKNEDIVSVANQALEAIPSDVNTNDVQTSGKMFLLDQMLHAIHTSTKEKVVVVSNWTTTLNLVEKLLKIKRYSFLRLDGSTPQTKRQEYVDQFNRDSAREEVFVFLLSAKAGGVGLNLIGASRLILFDSDWNPSTDQQAMARIHRDGQKRPVYIYRLLTTNTIDEKIYQRQITKTGLSDQMMDHGQSSEKSKDSFSAAELRDIFTLNLRTNGCQTHDLLSCDCMRKKASKPIDDGSSLVDDDETDEKAVFVSASQYDPGPTPKMLRKAALAQKEKLAALKDWKHFDAYARNKFTGVSDVLLYNLMWDAWEGDPDAEAGLSDVDDGSTGGKRKRAKVHNDKGENRSRVAGTPGMEDNDSDADSKSEDASRNNTRLSRSVSTAEVRSNTKSRSTTASETHNNVHNEVALDSTFNEAVLANLFASDNEDDFQNTRSKDGDDSELEAKVGDVERESTTKAARSKKRKSIRIREEDGPALLLGKKHNLRSIAENGGAGRIMFLFEKKSDSEL